MYLGHRPWFAIAGLAVLCGTPACTVSPPLARRSVSAVTSMPIQESSKYKVRKILPLSIPDSVPLGLIAKGGMSGGGKRLLVADLGPTDAVYEFDSAGAYTTKHVMVPVGGVRPERLIDFASIENDLYLLGSYHLIHKKLSDDSLVSTVALPGIARRVTADANGPCVLSAGTVSLICFSRGLDEQHVMVVPSDQRYLRYAYEQISPTSLWSDGSIVVSAVYSPRLFVADRSKATVEEISFVDSAWDKDAFDAIWRKTTLLESDRRTIKLSVRRFEKVYALPDQRVLLLEVQRSTGLRQWCLLDLARQRMFRDSLERGPLVLGKYQFSLLDLVVGTGGDGLLGVAPDPATASVVADATGDGEFRSLCKEGVQCLFIFSPN
jgi:hypothetical protein